MVEFVTACRICALIAGLLVTAHFVNRPGDWIAIKATLSRLHTYSHVYSEWLMTGGKTAIVVNMFVCGGLVWVAGRILL